MATLGALPMIGAQAQTSAAEPRFESGIEAVLKAYETKSVVAIGEARRLSEEHLFLQSLIKDPRFAQKASVIVVEFANARYQSEIDRFIGGETATFETVRPALQNTLLPAAWDAQVYETFLTTVRDTNQTLPEGKKLRVIAGDPATDWQQIKTRADYQKWLMQRDDFLINAIEREALKKNLKALVIASSSRLTRKAVTESASNAFATPVAKPLPGASSTPIRKPLPDNFPDAHPDDDEDVLIKEPLTPVRALQDGDTLDGPLQPAPLDGPGGRSLPAQPGDMPISQNPKDKPLPLNVTQKLSQKLGSALFVMLPHVGFAADVSGLEAKTASWKPFMATNLQNNWLGEVDASQVMGLGKVIFQRAKLKEIADAYLFLGESSRLKVANPSSKLYTDSYLTELSRRWPLAFGKTFAKDAALAGSERYQDFLRNQDAVYSF